MIKIYCGGNFEFKYKDFSPKKLKSDYRAILLGSVDKILHRPESKSVPISDSISYIGPFYFYEDNLDGAGVVTTEYQMVEDCDEAIFLVDNTNIPGTVSEIIHAAMLKKAVTIFYVEKTPDKGEPDQEIHNTNWYPIQFAWKVNANTILVRCKDRKEAKSLICDYVKRRANA